MSSPMRTMLARYERQERVALRAQPKRLVRITRGHGMSDGYARRVVNEEMAEAIRDVSQEQRHA